LGGVARGAQIVHICAMFKALLLPDYISEQPQFFRDAGNFDLRKLKLPLTLENFTAKYQKVCEISWAKLSTK